MPKRYTADELVKILKKDGWYLVSQEGSHMQFKHPEKKGKVTVAFHKGVILPKTAASILKQAGLK